MKLKIGKSVRLDHVPYCPVCNERLDGATVIDHSHAIPRPGDITVCFGCASFLTYQPNMDLRLLTELEVYGLDTHAKALMIEMRKRIREYRTNGTK